MAGHSKWANIKHQKGAADKKRGKVFSKLAKEIMVAAKMGGADEAANPKLRTALISAKAANLPKDNIERAIKKGTGDLEGVTYEELLYEGYGAGGTAFLVEVLTDNKNRSASDIRMTFDRTSGNMANGGAVAWMFQRKAHFVIVGDDADEDKLMDLVLDAGADDIVVNDDVAEIFAEPSAFEAILNVLTSANIKTEEAAIIQHPDNFIDIETEKIAIQVLRLVDKLEDLDDVQAVHSNFQISDGISQKLEQ